jgi:hypothetical protein
MTEIFSNLSFLKNLALSVALEADTREITRSSLTLIAENDAIERVVYVQTTAIQSVICGADVLETSKPYAGRE